MNLNSIFESVHSASKWLMANYDAAKINELLKRVAEAIPKNCNYLLEENAKDLALMDKNAPKYDRLMLTSSRLEAIANDMYNVASLPSPIGKLLEHRVLPNGLELSKVSVPFGVIGIIYEARPNVSFDVFSLCLKAGSCSILKGGSDAENSNRAIVNLIHSILEREGIDKNIVALLPPSHEATNELLHAKEYVDMVIPRGSASLINFVRENAKVPVIETGAGVCHAYFDKDGDIAVGARVVNNAKTRRVSVCNALDCLVVHQSRLADLPQLCAPLQESNVIIYADQRAYAALEGKYPQALLQRATQSTFGTEFQDYKMAVKSVDSLEQAIEHIGKYGSGHSETIVSTNKEACNKFVLSIDAACVYTNAPTSFTDGAQFGMGAEIGISTQKLHARGPMALEEITTYKWVIKGDGQTRP